jgi:ADP-ribosylglycohydrolase
MALALARAVVGEGRHDDGKVLEAYRAWYRTGPFDVGDTTRAALVGYLMAESQANGSLMRASPLAILAHGARAEEAAELGRRDSALTHPNPVCRDIGWVLVTQQNAFHELLHAPSVEAGVVATVRRGGDTDTNGAVAGALLGAVHGRSAIPLQWRSMILSCRPHPLRARHPRPPSCWPVDALELAEGLLLAGA